MTTPAPAPGPYEVHETELTVGPGTFSIAGPVSGMLRSSISRLSREDAEAMCVTLNAAYAAGAASRGVSGEVSSLHGSHPPALRMKADMERALAMAGYIPGLPAAAPDSVRMIEAAACVAIEYAERCLAAAPIAAPASSEVVEKVKAVVEAARASLRYDIGLAGKPPIGHAAHRVEVALDALPADWLQQLTAPAPTAAPTEAQIEEEARWMHLKVMTEVGAIDKDCFDIMDERFRNAWLALARAILNRWRRVGGGVT